MGQNVTETALSNTAPTTTGASTAAGFWDKINAFDIASQVVSSLNPEAGAALAFLRGGVVDGSGKFVGVGGTIQNLASTYGKLKAAQELERFAKKNGMSLAELNLALVALSFAGNKLVGTRFNPNTEITYEDGSRSIEQVMFGMFDRQKGGLIDSKSSSGLNKIIGSPFDVIDVVLGYAGILTASDYDFIQSGEINQRLLGHSLGTLGASNLVSRGYLDSNLAELYSLPFGNVAPSGVKLFIGTVDGVNGFVLGLVTNPRATLISGCFHPLQCYLDKTRSD